MYGNGDKTYKAIQRQKANNAEIKKDESERKFNDIQTRLDKIGKKLGYDKKLSNMNNSEFDSFLDNLDNK